MSRPQMLGDIIPAVMKKLGLTQKLKQAEAIRDWPMIVGEAIAKHAKPISLEKAVLLVHVDSSPWLNELQRFSKGIILKKLQERLSEKTVKDIRFRIGDF